MDEKVDSDEQRILGRDAQRNNILAARVISETVKTTLGPKGMDKMLVDRSGNVIITNDGVTILEEMEIDHPAAKMIVEIARTQEDEVGDGTTTAVMLAGKLLENAEKLLDQKIHPTIITRGYTWASEKAVSILEDLSIEINSKEELLKVAQTAMTGKGAEFLKEKFAEIVVDSVEKIAENGVANIEDIKIEKQKGGSLSDTKLIEGLVISKKRASSAMPKEINEARIALIEEALEVRQLEQDARISISMPDQMQGFIEKEEQMLKEKVDKIKSVGANVVFVSRSVDDLVKFYLAKEGVYLVSNVSEEDLSNLSKATGAKVVSKLKELIGEDLGYSKSVFEKKVGEEFLTYVIGCKNPKSLTILIHGGSDHVIDEVERAIKDSLGDVLATLKDSKVVSGGGSVEMELSKKLLEYSKSLNGRERLAVEEFAKAMEFIPLTLAENAGLDPIDVLTELRANHDAGKKNVGLNLFKGKVEDNLSNGIIEPLKVKVQAVNSASEVAIMILRIDDVIAAKKRKDRGYDSSYMKSYE